MAEGRQRNQWDLASTLLAHLTNLHTDTRKHGVRQPAEFNPFEARRAQAPKVKIAELRGLFVHGLGFTPRRTP